MSNDSLDIKTDGTIIEEGGQVYLFANDRAAIPTGQVITPDAAMGWLKGKLGRNLTHFEVGLLLAEMRGGKKQITIASALVYDRSQSNPLLAGSYKPFGYFILLRASSRSVNYGSVIQTEGFYDENGNLLGELRKTVKDEPPLEKPLLDPIDFVAGPLANLIRGAAKKLIAGASASIEARLLARGGNAELGKLATLTEKELAAIRGGAASQKPPLLSAEALNKEVPQIRDGLGLKRRLTDRERTGAREIIGTLERVRNGNSWAWVEFINSGRRIQRLQFGKLAQQGWWEIDLLAGNPGALNQMRMLVRVGRGDIEYKLMQVH